MSDILTRIRRALDRGSAPVPAPPAVHEPTARRVYTELGLPELFVHAARAAGMSADLVYLEQLPAALADHLRQQGVIGVTVGDTPMLRKIRLAESLGLLVGPDAIVTGCDAAVAETGSLAFRGSPPPGWSTARVRIAVLEPKNFVPDLIDFFAAHPGDVTLIGGPSVRTFVLH